jgi:hypothetical protein
VPGLADLRASFSQRFEVVPLPQDARKNSRFLRANTNVFARRFCRMKEAIKIRAQRDVIFDDVFDHLREHQIEVAKTSGSLQASNSWVRPAAFRAIPIVAQLPQSTAIRVVRTGRRLTESRICDAAAE